MEALQRGLAGVAGGGGEDDDIVGHAELAAGLRDKLRQHGQRHVLKGACRPVEKLQHVNIAAGNERRQPVVFKLAEIGPAHERAHIPKLRKEEA